MPPGGKGCFAVRLLFILQKDGGKAVVVVVGFGDEIGVFFDIVFGIGHSDADAGRLKHGNIVGFVPGRQSAGKRDIYQGTQLLYGGTFAGGAWENFKVLVIGV